MHIKHVELKNFRGFREVSIDLDPRLVVLAGPNGCGKTSFLRALWLGMQYVWEIMARTLNPFSHAKFSWDFYSDIRINKPMDELCFFDIDVCFDGELRGSAGCNFNSYGIFRMKQVSNSKGLDRIKEMRDRGEVNYVSPVSMFVGANRKVFHHDDVGFLQVNSIYPLVFDFDVIEGFGRLLDWFKGLEDIENERRLRDDPAYRDRGLQAVRDAITQAVPGFDGDTLFYRRREETFVIRKGAQELSFAQLSAGEQMFIVMVGDIARRLALASPGLKDPLQGEGVILIDEIEQHLHPSWQREAIRRLPKIFPNCQFIVATHSPAILSEVRPESIIALSPGEDGITARHPDVSYGLDVNAILEDVMGVTSRPVEVKAQIEALLRHIESGERLEEAREELGALERMIGAEDRELVFARALLRRKEVLGR